MNTLLDTGHNNIILYSYSEIPSIRVCLGCASYKYLNFYCYSLCFVFQTILTILKKAKCYINTELLFGKTVGLLLLYLQLASIIMTAE